MFSLHSQFIESEEYLYLLGSEPWTRRSAEECRGPRTAETDCRKIDGTKAFMTSINDNMYTNRSHKHTVYEVLLLMEMISQKPIYSFSHKKWKRIKFKFHCTVSGWSLKISIANYQTWHLIKSEKLRPIWWPQLKRYMNESNA